MTDLPARIRTLIDDHCGPAWPPSGELRVALEALHDIAAEHQRHDCWRHGHEHNEANPCATTQRIAAAVEQIEGG